MSVTDYLFSKNKDPRLTTEFSRKFFESHVEFTHMGEGSLGGKSQSLIGMKDFLSQNFDRHKFPGISFTLSRIIVVSTDIFDEFMASNGLFEVANSNLPDDQIAHALQRTELPARLMRDLNALMTKISTPLAIRSFSLLEDVLYELLAGF